jgi:hypothetical protein
MLRFILNLLGFKPKAPRVYRTPDGSHFIVITGTNVTGEYPLQMGRLIDVKDDTIGPEQPTDTIARFMPGEDFQPYSGPLPPAVQRLLEQNGVTLQR